ncbi:MAG TPA: SCP2 sterol-binding domain-containing protein [Mycobacteriales bacterium]|nr:SCP2 sterol-binding domain-containing protein [Mycobacteriales bacterium]
MATVRQCRAALGRLTKQLDGLDPALRTKHVPQRTVACKVSDLDVTFTARLSPDGVHDIAQCPAAEAPDADVRLALDSDLLIALANGEEEFMTAWLRGRLHVSASMRDMLRLRAFFGL